jgi:hypothetical protein
MRSVLLAALAGLLLVPASASAAGRFSGCVAESVGCTHTFTGGSAPLVRFKDRQAANTRYRVCVKDPISRRCWKRTTKAAGHWHRAFPYYNARTYGKHIVRWYVAGAEVAHWRFKLISEGD